MDLGKQTFIQDRRDKNIDTVDILNASAEKNRRINSKKCLSESLQAIKLAKEIDYKEGLAESYLNHGIACRLISDYVNAVKSCDEALTLFREIGNIKKQSRALNSIANIYYTLSAYENAIDLFSQCIELTNKSGEEEFKALVLCNLGLSYQESGNLYKAVEYYFNSLEIYNSKSLEIPYSLMNNMGIVYQEMEEYKISLEYFHIALKNLQKRNNPIDQAMIISNIGLNYLYIEDFVNAITYFTEAMIVIKTTGNVQVESRISIKLSKAYSKIKCYPIALEYYFKALQYIRQTVDKSSLSEILNEIGNVYFELRDFINAKNCYRESLEAAIDRSDHINEMKNYIDFAKLYEWFSELDTAVNYYKKAMAIAEKTGCTKNIISIFDKLINLYKTHGIIDQVQIYEEQKSLINAKHLDLLLNNQLLEHTNKNVIKKNGYNKFYVAES